MTKVMFDSVDPTLFPDPATVPFDATAGYVNGRWPSSAGIRARFPDLPHLSIAVTASADADCLDVEPGDATPADAPGWLDRQNARGLTKPAIYCGIGDIAAVRKAVGTRPFWWFCARWKTPRVPFMESGADATQWNDRGPNGEGVDQSQISDAFYRYLQGVTPMALLPDERAILDELLNVARTGRRDGSKAAWPYDFTPAAATLNSAQSAEGYAKALPTRLSDVDVLRIATAVLDLQASRLKD